jgi:hypothetical protein
MNPQDVNLYSIDTSKGSPGIFVQSVVEAVNGNQLFVTMVLERDMGDDHIESRNLKMSVLGSELTTPSGRIGILNSIRNWIETTEGDEAINSLGS